MIVDNIRNASLYYSFSKELVSALKFLETQDLKSLSIGRHEIDGDNCFALVQEYDSKPIEQGKWEAHRRYIDVQYVVDGTERMGYADIRTLTVTQEYDESKDAMLLAGDGDMLTFKAGSFAVFAPEDAHMPQIAVTEPQKMRKIVVKVRAK